MGSRGPQSFKKRQKEQQRKEKQQEKMAKRLERKLHPGGSTEEENVEGPADGRFHDHLDGYVDNHAEPAAPADRN